MSHVDEGLLHAYLDRPAGKPAAGGKASEWQEVEAHLAQCARCRAELDRARRVRDRAAEILRGSGPAAIEVPPFEDLRSTVRRESATARRLATMSRLKLVGAAASIVLAVAVGWVARGALRMAGPREPVAREASPLESAEPSRPGTRSPEAASGETRTLERAPAQTAAPGAGAIESQPTSRAAAPDVAQRAAQQAEQPEPPRAEFMAAAEFAGDTLARAADEVIAPREAMEGLRGRAEMARRAVQPAPVGLEPPRRPVREVEIGTWSPATAEGARAYIGTAIALVPELEARSYATGIVGGRRAVRVIQDLGGGDVLAVTQVAGASEADLLRQEGAAGVQGAGITGEVPATVSELRGGYLITLRGSLSPDSLRVLLARIPSERP